MSTDPDVRHGLVLGGSIVAGVVLAFAVLLLVVMAAGWIGGVLDLRFGQLGQDLATICREVHQREADLDELARLIREERAGLPRVGNGHSGSVRLGKLEEAERIAANDRLFYLRWYNQDARFGGDPVQFWLAGRPYQVPEEPYTPGAARTACVE